jgi:hypothetical protein
MSASKKVHKNTSLTSKSIGRGERLARRESKLKGVTISFSEMVEILINKKHEEVWPEETKAEASVPGRMQDLEAAAA